ncbi:MAG: hypothetical protein MJ204_02115 [Bacteroidales bacterium]|nr:hypothetical protein [Bacteroidales bacterium]
MAQLNEIMDKEQQRDVSQYAVAVLYREGSFLRAYEWSAWLFLKFYGDLKVTNRLIKSLGKPMAFVGFPLSSIEKFTPQGASIIPETDGSVKMVMPLEINDAELFKSEFEAWQQSLPLEEKTVKTKQSVNERDAQTPAASGVSQKRVGVFSIIQKIASYPIESKNPTENLQFITELKLLVNELL